MRLLKRIQLNLFYQKGKSLFLFFSIVLITVTLTFSFSFHNATLHAKKKLLQSKPPVAAFQIDQKQRSQYTESQVGTRPEFLDREQLEKIVGDGRIKTYDYNVNINHENTEHYAMNRDDIIRGKRMKIFGYHHEKMVSLFNKIKIVEGRGLSKDELENGEQVIIISNRLAKDIGKKIGDTFTLREDFEDFINDRLQIVETMTHPMKIVGIYEALEDIDDLDIQRRIYTSEKFVSTYHFERNKIDIETASSQSLKNWENLLYDTIQLYMNFEDYDAAKMYRFDFSKTYPGYFKLQLASDNLDILSKPLDNFIFMSILAFKGSLIIGTLLIATIVTIYVNARKYEIGLLRLMGERAYKTFACLMVEVYIITCIALGLGLVVGLSASNLSTNAISASTLPTHKASVTETLPFDDAKTPGQSQDKIEIEPQSEAAFAKDYAMMFVATIGLTTLVVGVVYIRINPAKLII